MKNGASPPGACGPKYAIAAVVAVSLLLLFCSFADSVFAQVRPSGTASKTRTQRRQGEAWFLRGRRISRESAAALRYSAYLQKMQMRAAHGSAVQAALPAQQASSSGWSSLGPAPLASDASGVGQQDYNWVSGRATAVAIDPADVTANTVYLGGAYGGVWKSSNAASPSPASVIWTALTDSQPTLAVGAIAVQPQLSNPNAANSVILVGTGEANSSADSYYGLGILRSADAGGTWTLISTDSTGTRSFAGMAFSKIAFSTSHPNLVVGATAGASQGILEGKAKSLTANLGLYYSQDAGASWTYANVQDGAVVTAPGSVSTVVYNAMAGQFFAALRYHGFYSSPDGINWTRLVNQPGTGLTLATCPTQSSSAACPIYRGEIAVVPGRNEMYVWYVDVNDNDQGIWESTNGGATWTQINDSGITNCGDDLGCGTGDGTYNLELAAVPDGGATDLYAGAINLYKCQITSAVPDCSGSAPNTFLNLIHAYGCSSIAKVHPAQHSLSFQLLNNNTQDVMYFANDGGIYRALNGYALTDGACDGHAPPFDSLNQTLGSITQFVSFSQSPGDDGYPILGGTQGNGSPARESAPTTQSALANSPWLNVNAGDGGYNQINPRNPDEWFVSTPPDGDSGVNIFRCELGINCHTQDFQNDEVVSSATLGGDTGAFYTPYILDPRNPSELLVGTCRMWRGSSSGTGLTPLSNNLETGGVGICTGSETNLVRSLAAGGPLDGNGFSNVVYAGTDGFGPLIPAIPSGGHIWVTTNAADGPSTWNDQTGAINPSNFPISGIAIDNSDATGQTAYVTIMGFHVSHVWKTANGGTSWTDFTGNLPDAPANAVLVDSSISPSTVYVGTDVGVFTSSAVSPSWIEVGPAPGSGQTGFLPNVAVTALGMFNDGTDKWLRASTYGRGIWQFGTGFLPAVANTPLTAFADQLPAKFSGQVLFYAYNYSVNLRCIPPAAASCTVMPSSVTPISPAFTVAADGPIGTSTFTVRGAGTDPNNLTGDAPFTLNVVDFNLISPSVSSLTLPPGATSAPVTFQVTASGQFSQTVNLSCAGLPTGAVCNFQSSSPVAPTVSNPAAAVCNFQPFSVAPTASSPARVALTICTTSDATVGTFAVTIHGSVANGPTKPQKPNLSLAVIDYSQVIANPSLTASGNAIAVFKGTLTSLNGYSSPVNLSCGTGAPPTCTVTPTRVTPTASGASFTVTVGSKKVQTYNFVISAVGTDPFRVTHTFRVSFTSIATGSHFTFSITANPQSTSVKAGNTATYQLQLTPSSGTFPSEVTLSFTGCPPLSTCSLSQTSVAAGSGGKNLSFSIQTAAAVVANTSPATAKWRALCAFWFWLPGFVVVAHRTGRRHPQKHMLVLLSLAVSILTISLMTSCGGGLQGGSTASANPGTPAGAYNMTVSASMNSAPGSPTQTADLTLTVN
jgi:hypothetical protein